MTEMKHNGPSKHTVAKTVQSKWGNVTFKELDVLWTKLGMFIENKYEIPYCPCLENGKECYQSKR
jgi:hypothetical protein